MCVNLGGEGVFCLRRAIWRSLGRAGNSRRCVALSCSRFDRAIREGGRRQRETSSPVTRAASTQRVTRALWSVTGARAVPRKSGVAVDGRRRR